MKFCPKCGSIMMPKNVDGTRMLVCTNCGYKEPMPEDTRIYRIDNKIKHNPREEIVVVEENMKPMPTARVFCPKCGYKEAYVWQVQTRSADEPPTTFYRCKRCGHTWREY